MKVMPAQPSSVPHMSKISKAMYRKTFLALVLAACMSQGLHADASVAASQLLSKIRLGTSGDQPSYDADPKTLAIFQSYCTEMETKWAENIRKDPESFPELLRNHHETIQLYFSDRRKFSRENLAMLLSPPMTLKTYGVPEFEYKELADASIRIRGLWFALWNKLSSENLLEEDTTLTCVGIATEYLHDLEVSTLVPHLSEEELDVIMRFLMSIPPYSDTNITKLANLHTQKSGNADAIGSLVASKAHFGDRASFYKAYFKTFEDTAQVSYGLWWRGNPSVFERRILALIALARSEINKIAVKVAEKENEASALGVGDVDRLLKAVSASSLNFAAEEIPQGEHLSKTEEEYIKEMYRYAPSKFSFLKPKENAEGLPSLSRQSLRELIITAGDYHKATQSERVGSALASLYKELNSVRDAVFAKAK
jgi:hypothetical protein